MAQLHKSSAAVIRNMYANNKTFWDLEPNKLPRNFSRATVATTHGLVIEVSFAYFGEIWPQTIDSSMNFYFVNVS